MDKLPYRSSRLYGSPSAAGAATRLDLVGLALTATTTTYTAMNGIIARKSLGMSTCGDLQREAQAAERRRMRTHR